MSSSEGIRSVRIGSDENEMNVSIAAFTMRPSVHDEDPIRRRGRWYGTLVSRKPLHSQRSWPSTNRTRAGP